MYQLVRKEKGKEGIKPIHIVSYSQLRSALNSQAFQILQRLAERPASPRQLAKDLGMHEQKVYYYIKRLRKAGLIEEASTEVRRGTICHFYAPVAPAFGIELLSKEAARCEPFENFFHEFVKTGSFDGLIVVGSPWPHGPFRTAARDGHWAIQLAGALGSLCQFDRFVPRLDIDISENELKQNLILIGGPVTNMITEKINKYLPARFEWREKWAILAEKRYEGRAGLVAKIANPFDPTKRVVVLAGLTFEGTKACIQEVIRGHILKKYKNVPFFEIIKNF
jgi:predicted transcriptional regulator